MANYDFKTIEKKWQDRWEKEGTFRAIDDFSLPKFYGLIEFPYPSGAGMHVGHIKAYSGMEVICRKRRMQGYNVLFPIGFDAFGLPAENYAIKTGTHPRIVTDQNIHNFTGQLKRVGFAFDWSRVIDTTDTDYYKWTQWIFLKMFEHGLVFRDKAFVNYCPSCKCVLSNEDSQGGKCDICHSDVVQKSKDVWFLRITEYADKLLDGLKHVDFPANIKAQQENWIGRSTGAFVNFTLSGTDETLRIYTTRPDTLFGVTFMVMAPEHPLIDKYADRISNMDEVEKYRTECGKKTEFERTQLVKDKTGVKLSGLTAVNPVNGKEIPIFISDYVMMGYGTGAIMAVPAHDQRDWDFAKAFGIDIIQVIKGGDIEKEAYTGDGEMINSDFLNGTDNKKESIEKMLEFLKERGIGEKGVQYKMKDWAFNRQRYWGEPIPIIHCPHCGMVAVPENELPLKLPDVENFEPGEGGESPLAKIDSFVNCTCPKCGAPAKRETDTMPQWAGSSWYFLRYIDPHNDKCFADKDKLKYWLPVDWYNGGMEHTTLHLLYSRFWHKFLYDIGVVHTKEPYAKRTSHGMILGQNPHYVGNVSTEAEKQALIEKYGNQALRPAVKMSKSLGNVVNPDDVVKAYGADTMRLYIMFIGDFEKVATWSDEAVKGSKRFLDRCWNLMDMASDSEALSEKNEAIIHKTIRKVTQDIDELKMNTAIAALMTMVNEFYANGCSKGDVEMLCLLLSPFAPHMVEEMWENMGFAAKYGKMAMQMDWPEHDEAKTVDSHVEMAVQVNGKLKGTVTVPVDSDEAAVVAAAMESDKVKKATEGMSVVKTILVRNKLVNLIVKPAK